MNKNGQALVLFIVLIPVFLVLTAIFVDKGINSYNDRRFRNITEDIMEELLNNDILNNVTYDNEDEVKEILKKQATMIYDANEIGVEFLTIEIGYGNEVTLFNTYEHYSFMNSLFGRGNGMRQISLEVIGEIEDGEKIIEFKDGSNEDK